jgi:uncharacterized protein YodC (DUF2158 family)
MEQLQQRDVVQLLSGGPQMTVAAVDEGSGKVKCVWFEKNKTHEEAFDIAVLKKVPKLTSESWRIHPRGKRGA